MSDSDYLMNELAVLGQPVLAGRLNPAQWCVDLYLTRCISIADSFCWLAGVNVDIHADEIQSRSDGDVTVMIIQSNSKEWRWMWAQLKSEPINQGDTEPVNCEHPLSGDVWEYQFSDLHEKRHVFRHKNHPVTQQPEWLRIPFSGDFSVSGQEE